MELVVSRDSNTYQEVCVGTTPMEGFGTSRRLGFHICVERFAEASCDDTQRFQRPVLAEAFSQLHLVRFW